jgi:hypothetical protein
MAHVWKDMEIEVHRLPKSWAQAPTGKESIVLSHSDHAGAARAAGEHFGWQGRWGEGRAATGGQQRHPFHICLRHILARSYEEPEHAARVLRTRTQQPPSRGERHGWIDPQIHEAGG